MTTALPMQFKVGLVQMRMSDDPRPTSVRPSRESADAAQQGATLVCLPELFRTLYIGQREGPRPIRSRRSGARADDRDTRQGREGERRRRDRLAVRASSAGLYHNTAAVIDADGKVKGFIGRCTSPDDPSYYEKFYFTPGDLGFRAFDTKVGPIGTLVCWDQWYPEGARLTALQGANILLYPTAIGWHPSEKEKYGEQQLDAWKTIQRSHAIANGCWVAAVNRVGFERPVGEGGGAGNRVLGPFVRVRSVRRGRGGGRRTRRWCSRRSISRGSKEVTAQLAVLRDRRVDAYDGHPAPVPGPISSVRMPAEWEPHAATWTLAA